MSYEKTANKKPAKNSSGKKRGRKKGQQTEKADQVPFVPTRCRRCDSTERTPYIGTPVVTNYEGVAPDGKKYNRVVRKRTRCKVCGQLRFDVCYELV